MRAFICALLFLQFASFGALAETVKVGDTGVVFEAPKGFNKLSQKIMDLKWPRKSAPKFAIGNKSAATTIAYDLKPHVIPQERLGDVKTAFAKLFNKAIPGIKWIEQKIIEQSGQKWVYFEMTSNAVDTDIHNMMLITGFKGKMLLFNFNSTKKEFPKYEKALRASMASIVLPKK